MDILQVHIESHWVIECHIHDKHRARYIRPLRFFVTKSTVPHIQKSQLPRISVVSPLAVISIVSICFNWTWPKLSRWSIVFASLIPRSRSHIHIFRRVSHSMEDNVKPEAQYKRHSLPEKVLESNREYWDVLSVSWKPDFPCARSFQDLSRCHAESWVEPVKDREQHTASGHVQKSLAILGTDSLAYIPIEIPEIPIEKTLQKARSSSHGTTHGYAWLRFALRGGNLRSPQHLGADPWSIWMPIFGAFLKWGYPLKSNGSSFQEPMIPKNGDIQCFFHMMFLKSSIYIFLDVPGMLFQQKNI